MHYLFLLSRFLPHTCIRRNGTAPYGEWRRGSGIGKRLTVSINHYFWRDSKLVSWCFKPSHPLLLKEKSKPKESNTIRAPIITATGNCIELLCLVRYLVSWCFEPWQPQRITSGLNTYFTLFPSHSFHKSSHHKSRFWSLFIFRGHSTREPASSRLIYFILRAYTGTMC